MKNRRSCCDKKGSLDSDLDRILGSSPVRSAHPKCGPLEFQFPYLIAFANGRSGPYIPGPALQEEDVRWGPSNSLVQQHAEQACLQLQESSGSTKKCSIHQDLGLSSSSTLQAWERGLPGNHPLFWIDPGECSSMMLLRLLSIAWETLTHDLIHGVRGIFNLWLLQCLRISRIFQSGLSWNFSEACLPFLHIELILISSSIKSAFFLFVRELTSFSLSNPCIAIFYVSYHISTLWLFGIGTWSSMLSQEPWLQFYPKGLFTSEYSAGNPHSVRISCTVLKNKLRLQPATGVSVKL